MKTSPFFKMWPCALALGFLMIPFQLAFGQTGNVTAAYPTAEEDLETAKATVKAYETGDWDELRSHLKEDAWIFGVGNTDSLNVDQTLEYWSKGRETAIPSIAEEGSWFAASIDSGARKGNWVFHWGTNTLTYQNGEEITFPYHVAMKIEDDKVVESHFFYDNMKIIRGLGYAISPPLEDEEEDEDRELHIEQNN